MMAPLFTPERTSPPQAEIQVRLDVRVGSGRSTSFALESHEFLIGSATGCDLRLPGPHTPPVVAQLALSEGQLRLRRIAPAYPIILNGESFTGTAAALLHPGDRITLGSAEIVVNLLPTGHLHPRFASQDVASAQNVDRESQQLAQERRELESLRLQLEEQQRELEADRVAWYRRRQELEAEAQRVLQLKQGPQNQALREQELLRREAEVERQREELSAVRDELALIRQSLLEQYHGWREQYAEREQTIQAGMNSLREQQAHLEAESARWREYFRQQEKQLAEQVEQQVQARVLQLDAEHRRRVVDLEIEHEQRLQRLEAAEQLRIQQLAEHLEQQTSARDVSQSPPADQESLEQEKSLREELQRERQALDNERLWHEERVLEQERMLAARERELDDRSQQVSMEIESTRIERQKLHEETRKLYDWQRELHELQVNLENRAREVDSRTEQQTRDAIEIEEQFRLLQAELQRFSGESERLANWKAELEHRSEALTKRSAELEAQHASLALLRVRLDRRQEELDAELARLTLDRTRIDQAQRDLDQRLSDAEMMRVSLSNSEASTEATRSAIAEQNALLATERAELLRQREALTAEESRLKDRELALDARAAEMAEQTAILKAKTAQVLELQERLETDRLLVRDRESGIIEAEQARLTFQEQLRKRAEELAERAKAFEESARTLDAERADLERKKVELAQDREEARRSLMDAQDQLRQQAEELDRGHQRLTEREAALARQIQRLRETGRSVATGRKHLHESKLHWQAEQKKIEQLQAEARQLREFAPELQDQSLSTLQRLSQARDFLRQQLGELHAFADQSRQALDTLRDELRAEAEQIRNREALLEKARAEHRHAVAEFRQQLLDWQSRVGDLKTMMARSENRLETRHAALEAATRQADQTALTLVRRAEELKLEQDRVLERRTEVERHLAEMREWYRTKLRELAAAPNQELAQAATIAFPKPSELDPGDRQLGELLKSLDLVDAETLASLWNEATRQHRTLRQVLLANGAITLYQLALIEAGNLDALMLDRFRVVDRIRMTPREAVYRVHDPRVGSPDGDSLSVLRILGEAEMMDAMHPDEYRQRFQTASTLNHPNLVQIREVLDIHSRPAVLQEYVSGVPGSLWPADCLTPAAWIKIMLEVTGAVQAGHSAGIAHGHLSLDSILLVASGVIKVTGTGEPLWLVSGQDQEATPQDDLAALAEIGTIAFALISKKKGKAARGTDSITAVLQRLGSKEWQTSASENGTRYRNAEEVIHDLQTLAGQFPCTEETWNEFLRIVLEYEGERKPRRSA